MNDAATPLSGDPDTSAAAAAPPPTPARPGVALWVATLALAASVGVGALSTRSLRADRAAVGLRLSGHLVGGGSARVLRERVSEVTAAWLDAPIRLTLLGDSVSLSRREAGFVVDRATLEQALLSVGRSGNPLSDLVARARARRGRIDLALGATVDRTRALEALADVKDRLDRPPVDAKLDLEHHGVAREQPGTLIQVYQSLVNLEYAAREGSDEVALAAVVTPPRVTAETLGAIDIGSVLGSWQTPYSSTGTDSDRTYNLKVGASKVDGTVIAPHQVFSFNQVTGDRTEKEGYRVAPVIQAGELVDGLAGGMCQIASTLHAASWFAGLDILESTPHSRPSAYITMGLDSTVVYPTVDLKLRNPYDFPVVIHYKVNQGFVRAEILGKARTVKVAFERQILQESGFGRVVRGDPTLRVGQRIVDQEGHSGYRILRRRVVYEKRPDQPLRKPEQRVVAYPSTTEYVRVGTGSAKLKKKDIPPSHHIPPPEKAGKDGLFRIVR
jgi:vancomycin resistance protein YoaR